MSTLFRNLASMIILAGMCVSLTIDNCRAQEEMTFQLTSDKDEYNALEPIKLKASLHNVSNSTIRIPEIEYLGTNMEYMYYSIVYPNGDRMKRHFNYEHSYIVRVVPYTGEPLAPGNSVRASLYPIYTRPIDSRGHSGKAEVTFQAPGIYEVQLVYDVSRHKALWQPPDGSLRSNRIRIEIVEPTPEEYEILNAIWAFGSGLIGPVLGDNSVDLHDEEALRAVIAKYPQNPMIKHAHLALAKSLCWHIGDIRKQEEAVSILEMIMDRYTSYRAEEVRQHLGYAHWRAGHQSEALEVFDNAVETMPYLKDNYVFMKLKLIVAYSSDPETCNKILTEWSRSRKNGERFEE